MKETRQASSEQVADYIQLNQYKLQGVVGQGSYGIVKLAYNQEDDTHYVRYLLSIGCFLMDVGKKNLSKNKKTTRCAEGLVAKTKTFFWDTLYNSNA